MGHTARQMDQLDYAALNPVPSPMPVDEPIGPLPRLQRLRADLLAAPYELCTQKAELMTDYLQRVWPRRPLLDRLARWHYRAYASTLLAMDRSADQGAADPRGAKTALALTASSWLMRLYCRSWRLEPQRQMRLMAEALRHVLGHMELRAYDHELIVGNCSSRRMGAPIHPDFAGMLMLGDLADLSTRSVNPLATTPAQVKDLQERIFPFWFNRSVMAHAPGWIGDQRLLLEMKEGRSFALSQIAGISHVTPDHGKVLRLGFAGIAAEIEARRRSLLDEIDRGRPSRGQREQLAMLDASAISAQAACDYGRRWRQHLLELAAGESDAQRRAELSELADILAVVPEHPARTLHQALQSIILVHAMLHQENFQHGMSFGRLDQLLLPYYRDDLAAGRLTPARAVELLGCFLGKAAELLPLLFSRVTEYVSGLSSASGITLGGVLADGTDASNELSSLFLLAYDQMRLRQPNIHVRVHSGSDPGFLDLCARTVGRGGGMPAFFSDEAVVPALMRDGIDPTRARDYSIVGCAEWGVPGCSFPAAGAGTVNLAHCLELALRGGMLNGEAVGPATPPLPQLRTVDDLLQAFRLQLRAVLERAATANGAIERVHALLRPTPLLSTVIEGCVARARDVTAGGADINTSGLQGIGLADVVDSVVAVEALVFSGELEPERLLAALDDDFAGESELAERLRWRLPKYGEDDPRSGEMAAAVARIYIEEVGRLPHPRGGRYVAGFWGMTTHQGMGSRTGALPSGRRAGRPLGNGISPQIGSESRGPTAALNSAARVPTPGNGMVMNLKLNPALANGSGGAAAVLGLVRGYFAQGGAQVQFNVIDSQTLRAAQADPASYRDLVVRISGYSAYFCDLTRAMQDELIDRTMHG